MSHKKPIPDVSETFTKICPICGKPSYSSGGIHPQCAMLKSDAPRKERLKAKQKIKKKSKEQGTWKKKCPKCHSEIHVRRKACDCGHAFVQAASK